MTSHQKHALDTAWTSLAATADRHHRLQKSGASVAELWQSRRQLDEARLNASLATA